MTNPTSATPDYTSGFSDPYMQYLMRHTAETHAAYLLPYLRPGLRVLDMGCGPGTVSVGMAKAVQPGEMHGIDMEESQIELARSVAEEAGQSNAIFHVGDVTDLPFEEGFFDVVHCLEVLNYVPDTYAALSEAKRVLKPGGILGCREIICESSATSPDLGGAGQMWTMFEDLLAFDDGHPHMGRDLKFHVLEAGFTNPRLTATFDVYSDPADIAFVHNFINNWLLSPEMTEAAIMYGAGTEELYNRMRVALDRWKDHPGAVTLAAFGEVIASKP